MGIFSGLGKASATGRRAPFITPGTYLCEVQRCSSGRSRKRHEYFSAQMHIHKVIEEFEANPEERELGFTRNITEGNDTTWYVDLVAGEPELSLGNIKNFLIAALEPDDDGDDLSDDDWEELAESTCEDTGELLAGTFLVVYATTYVTKAGNGFTLVSFEPGEEMAAELEIEPINETE